MITFLSFSAVYYNPIYANEHLVSDLSVLDRLISDHHAVLFTVPYNRPSIGKKMIFRKYKTVDLLELKHDVAQSAMCAVPASTAIESAYQYHHVLSATLDKRAPMRTNLVSGRTEAPWLNNGIWDARARRRKAERRWRETGLTIHRDIFNTERLRVNTLVQSQKRDYYALKIQEHSCSRKGLFLRWLTRCFRGRDISPLFHSTRAPVTLQIILPSSSLTRYQPSTRFCLLSLLGPHSRQMT